MPPFPLAREERPHLTFRHWSGITPYTSSYEFAGSCVFGKQSAGKFSLRPNLLAQIGQALLLTYGRFFAEFLGDLSLVRLRLLALITCVGLRYGSSIDVLRSFSWKRAPLDSFRRISSSPLRLRLTCGFTYRSHSRHEPQSNKGPKVQRSVTPSLNKEVTEY